MEQWEGIARERVRDTYAKYTHDGDAYRLHELARCFAADGVLEVKGRGTATGHDEIVAMLSRDEGGASERPSVSFVRHMVANVRFDDVTPQAVRSSAYFLVLTQDGVDHWGRYRDLLVPVDGEWLLRHRRVTVDAAVPGGWLAGR